MRNNQEITNAIKSLKENIKFEKEEKDCNVDDRYKTLMEGALVGLKWVIKSEDSEGGLFEDLVGRSFDDFKPYPIKKIKEK